MCICQVKLSSKEIEWSRSIKEKVEIDKRSGRVMECTRKQDQSYMIVVCFNTPDAGIYQRLRFAPQVSPWFLRPLSILVWSALNALLVVGGAFLLVSAGVAWFLLSLLWASVWLPLFLIIQLDALAWVVVCLSWVLIRLSWSLIMCVSPRWYQICMWFIVLWGSEYEVCMSKLGKVASFGLRPFVKYMVREWRPWCRVLAMLCEEVVLMHDAIVN